MDMPALFYREKDKHMLQLASNREPGYVLSILFSY